ERGTEFHDGLVPVARAVWIEELLGEVVVGALPPPARPAQPAQPGQDAPHVAVYDGQRHAEGDRQDRARRVEAHARHAQRRLQGPGEAAAVMDHDVLRAAAEVAGPVVVAQTRPGGYDLLFGGRGQGGGVREAPEEAL